MRNTGIQWCDDTVNPTSGCDGCELAVKPPPGLSGKDLESWIENESCYAARTHRSRLAHAFPENYALNFHDVRLIPGRLQKAAAWRDLRFKRRDDKPWMNDQPRLIFISDMSDALSEGVPFEYLLHEVIRPVFAWQRHGHVGLWLTKRPERMAMFNDWIETQGFTWPDNLVAGTSVTTQPTADKRLPHLLNVRAKWHFVSVEPQRAPVDLRPWLQPKLLRSGVMNAAAYAKSHDTRALSWVINGGESGPNARPFDVEWARQHRDHCRAAGASFFMKQLGAVWSRDARADDAHGGNWDEWPADLRVRQVPNFNA